MRCSFVLFILYHIDDTSMEGNKKQPERGKNESLDSMVACCVSVEARLRPFENLPLARSHSHGHDRSF
jgi:hypothetical protein